MNDQKIKIMVIEDENLLLEAITKKLEISGVEVVGFLTANDSLEYLKNNDSNLPDLIWLDYRLIGMSGLEFMMEINKVEKWSKIPVIVVSNSASTEKVKSMMDLGVKQYYLKADYRLDTLVKTILDNVQKYSNTLDLGSN